MKRAPLNALQQVKAATTGGDSFASPASDVPARPAPSIVKTGREGKTNITGYFPKEYKTSLRLIQIKTDKNFQELIQEALTDLFRKHNVPVPTDKQTN
jgi:hypothetical protein